MILIDHVAKGKDANQRYPIGASQKLARCRGAAYDVSSVRETVSKLVLRKDTNGELGAPLGSNMAELVSDDGDYSPTLRLSVPGEVNGADSTLTAHMQKVSEALEKTDGLNKRQLRAAIRGAHALTERAIARLIEAGHVETGQEAIAVHHHLVTPYRQSS